MNRNSLDSQVTTRLLQHPFGSIDTDGSACYTNMSSPPASFLGIEAFHAFVTGAAGGVGSAVVRELLGRNIGAEQGALC